MANEWVLIERLSEPVDFTVADTPGIEKGTLMTLTDPRTAVAVSASGQIIAGVLAREKISGDGRTRSPLFQRGVFTMTSAVGPTIVAGSLVTTSGANFIRLATSAEAILGKVVGKALQDFTSNSTGHVLVGGA